MFPITLQMIFSTSLSAGLPPPCLSWASPLCILSLLPLSSKVSGQGAKISNYYLLSLGPKRLLGCIQYDWE